MTTARERVLGDIRRALGNDQQHAHAALHTRGTSAAATEASLIPLFAERVTEYKAWVGECTHAELPGLVATRLGARGTRFVVAADLPAGIVAEDVCVRDTALSHADIAATDGVVSLAAVGIAQTGTIVLDAGIGQGRRAITLLPDYHLCIVRAEQIVADVPAAIAVLKTAVVEHRAPLTFISGPSATSDIELNRVEGVHGPRILEVIIVR